MSINPVSGSAPQQQNAPVAIAKPPVPTQQSAVPQDTVTLSSAPTAKQPSSPAPDQGGNNQ